MAKLKREIDKWFEQEQEKIWAKYRDPNYKPVDEDYWWRELGFSSYEDYCQSPLWKKVRRRILLRDMATCRRCKGKATVVHHRRYTKETLEGTDDQWLCSLCEGCHKFIEKDEQGIPRLRGEEMDKLLDEHDPNDFPAHVVIKIGLRKKGVLTPALPIFPGCHITKSATGC
jgi:5-methylcytosine-specific restriction endonuclease McrA